VSRPIPASIVKAVAKCADAQALFILLDGIVYQELGAKTPKAFASLLTDWKRSTLPSLARSDVRYFRKDGRKEIEETTFRK
jgi:hypothetical protein